MPTQKYSSRFKVKSVLEALKYPDGVAAYCRSKESAMFLFTGGNRKCYPMRIRCLPNRQEPRKRR